MDQQNSKDLRPSVMASLTVRNRVLFPGSVLRIYIGKEKSVKLIESILSNEISRRVAGFSVQSIQRIVQIAIFTTTPDEENISRAQKFYNVGCIGKVVQMSHGNNDTKYKYSIVVQGMSRCRLNKVVGDVPYFHVEVAMLLDFQETADCTEADSYSLTLRKGAAQLIENLRQTAEGEGGARLEGFQQVRDVIASAPGGVLADLIIPLLQLPVEEQQALLEEVSVLKRLQKVHEAVQGRLKVFETAQKIQNDVEKRVGSQQKEFFLRQQIKSIRKELGEEEDSDAPDDLTELQARLLKANLPEAAKKTADREIRRLKRLAPAQPEHHVVRTYLEWLADLPWDKEAPDTLHIQTVEDSLNRDHYGLEKVKKRIVEYLAVRSLNKQAHGPIMCLVGPPGVGKTSLGRSVAQALNRPFQRLAFGGVSDEAEIRGHRRTYIGAMPGSIISCLRKAGTKNPVMLLDEIDKLGSSVKGGDPSAALLEVLDPEQNHTFTDHYIDLPFDLSSVFFIATANNMDTIPEPLLDRMEVIHIPGYTSEEKLHIAERYLLPKQLVLNGLTPDQISVSKEAITTLAADYTREAGVRQLEREIAAVCRNISLKLALWRETQCASATGSTEMKEAGADETPETSQERMPSQSNQEEVSLLADSDFPKIEVVPELLVDILGQAKYQHEIAGLHLVPGVVIGLAWTPAGGELLFIECNKMPGKGTITMTGKLGDVMKESASIAMSWIRSNFIHIAELIGSPVGMLAIDTSITDFHLHVPAGAISKDGPSAGVAITVALLSLLSQRTVSPSLAMTGEVTLRGLVLPVGGIKEKVIAAHKGGVTHVILPMRNKRDLEDLPKEVRTELSFSLVETMAEVCSIVFSSPLALNKPDFGASIESLRNPSLPLCTAGHYDINRKAVCTLARNVCPSVQTYSSHQAGQEEDIHPSPCSPVLISCL